MFRTYVWNDDYIDNATIRAEVNQVKTVLKEDFIKNIRGSGYMMKDLSEVFSVGSSFEKI